MIDKPFLCIFVVLRHFHIFTILAKTAQEDNRGGKGMGAVRPRMFQCAPPELQRLAIAACNKLIVKNEAMVEINLKEGAHVETDLYK